MPEALYNAAILRLAAHIPHHARLPAPMQTATKSSPICGAKITVDICTEEHHVSQFGQHVRACALGQASASILGGHIVGTSSADIVRVHSQLKAFLAGDSSATFDGEWHDLNLFAPAVPHRARHGSILLPFEAAVAALASVAA